jgi:plasmid stabilization system protein ParE
VTRRLVLQPEAEEDIRSARRWYEQQAPGLGLEFLRAVEAAIARIERTPELYAVVDATTRRARLRRFPFAVYYEMETGQLVIYAIWHHRRTPRGWQQRVR